MRSDINPGPPDTLAGDADGVQRPDGTRIDWDEHWDTVVVGFGAAGASAALESAQAGCGTLLIDRFYGGGATKRSGGIYYAGGGTRLQKAAGYDDSPEEMFKYLKLEAGDVVSDDVLRTFCNDSVANFDWLSSLGVPFPPSGEAVKASYPPYDCTLYFSGNEICPPYSDAAKPAPRGHRALGRGLTGPQIFKGFARAIRGSSVTVRLATAARQLVVDDAGAVIGLRVTQLRSNLLIRAIHRVLYFAGWGGWSSRTVTIALQRLISRIEQRWSHERYIRAGRGVILAAGGFVFNPHMMDEYAPDFANCGIRLGTVGDGGIGIRLGQSVGGQVDKMDRGCAWVFINPPTAWVRGILVGPDGQRICNEELYGSTIGVHMTEKYGGRGTLILDSRQFSESSRQIVREHMGWFQQTFAIANNFLNRKKADTLAGLATRAGIDPNGLQATVDEYNRNVQQGHDPLGKSDKSLYPILDGPYYALPVDTFNRKFPAPCISLGGLVVDGLSQRVIGDHGQPIDGLYAAGRTAVGVSSQCYVSGLSIADCVFSGRNAGRAVAAARVQRHLADAAA